MMSLRVFGVIDQVIELSMTWQAIAHAGIFQKPGIYIQIHTGKWRSHYMLTRCIKRCTRKKLFKTLLPLFATSSNYSGKASLYLIEYCLWRIKIQCKSRWNYQNYIGVNLEVLVSDHLYESSELTRFLHSEILEALKPVLKISDLRKCLSFFHANYGKDAASSFVATY